MIRGSFDEGERQRHFEFDLALQRRSDETASPWNGDDDQTESFGPEVRENPVGSWFDEVRVVLKGPDAASVISDLKVRRESWNVNSSVRRWCENLIRRIEEEGLTEELLKEYEEGAIDADTVMRR